MNWIFEWSDSQYPYDSFTLLGVWKCKDYRQYGITIFNVDIGIELKGDK